MVRQFLSICSLGLLTLSLSAADGDPVAIDLRTDAGDIRLELYPDKAPKTVANFLAYADAGHYDGGSIIEWCDPQ